MEISVQKNLAAPLMTLLKLHHATYMHGVCGIMTEGYRNLIEGVTLSSQALLSYCIEMDLAPHITDRIGRIDLSIPTGKLTYARLGELSDGYLLPPENSDGEIAMVTEAFQLSVLYCNCDYANPITEEEVMKEGEGVEGRVLTAAPLPLLPKTVRFTTTEEAGIVTIISEDLPQESLTRLFEDISQK